MQMMMLQVPVRMPMLIVLLIVLMIMLMLVMLLLLGLITKTVWNNGNSDGANSRDVVSSADAIDGVNVSVAACN